MSKIDWENGIELKRAREGYGYTFTVEQLYQAFKDRMNREKCASKSKSISYDQMKAFLIDGLGYDESHDYTQETLRNMKMYFGFNK